MNRYTPKQGDIVYMDFDPQAGHEQAGKRPAVIVSNDTAINFLKTRAMVCPITNTDKGIPIQPALDERTNTTGVILCDQARTLDLEARKAEYIEKLPDDILREVIDVIYSLIEIENK
jgi:mRNA interferase MazF